MADDLTGVKHLGDFSAVYVGGGDVDTLMDEFDRTGFEFVLKNYSEHGGTVYGGGGGSIVLGKFIDTRREIRRQYKTGVELLGKYSVFPGYRDENMDNWVSGHDSHLICIPDGIGVIIKDGKIIMSDKVENLEQTGTKKVVVKTKEEVSEYLYKGEVNELIRELATKDIVDVSITEPSLEEIFMEYYEK
jgi:hypothetical protein